MTTARLDRPTTREGLFLWIMHRFAEVFEDRAVLRGGMALRLMDCPRQTVDIDYVFVPFESKKEIAERIRRILDEIDGAEIHINLHSKMLRAELRSTVADLTDSACERELSGIVPPDELTGLALRIRTSIVKLADHL